MNVSNRPSWGAYTELPEQGLAFYLNGAINNMSSMKDYESHTPAQTLQGMVVVDLLNHKASSVFDVNHFKFIPTTLNTKCIGQKHIHRHLERW